MIINYVIVIIIIIILIIIIVYTGEIPQRLLDTDVHSAVTAKTSTTLWQQKRAQRFDSSDSDSAEITMCT